MQWNAPVVIKRTLGRYAWGYQFITLCSDVALLIEGAGGLVARFQREIQPGS